MFWFRKRHTTSAQSVPQFAVCERATATETSPLHLRQLQHSREPNLLVNGGLNLSGVLAACGAEVAWDRRGISREEVVAELPSQHESFHYCRDCLDFLGILSHV